MGLGLLGPEPLEIGLGPVPGLVEMGLGLQLRGLELGLGLVLVQVLGRLGRRAHIRCYSEKRVIGKSTPSSWRES